MFEPDERVTDLLHDVVPDAVCQLPVPTFTSTLLTPTLSEAVPLTVMDEAVNVCPLVGDVIVMVGSSVSTASMVTYFVVYPKGSTAPDVGLLTKL